MVVYWGKVGRVLFGCEKLELFPPWQAHSNAKEATRHVCDGTVGQSRDRKVCQTSFQFVFRGGILSSREDQLLFQNAVDKLYKEQK